MLAPCLAALLCAAPAAAQDRGARGDDAAYEVEDPDAYTPPPRDRLWYSNASYARVNPLGLVNLHRLGWRRRLSTRPSILFQDTYAFLGGAATLTPAWSRVGGYAEVQPLALLRVFTEVTAVGYYGTFDQVLTFPTDGRFSDRSIQAEGDRAEPTLGWTFTVGGTLRAAVGPVAARSTSQALRFDLSGTADGQYFYDQLSDRLAPDEGWLLLTDTDLLFVGDELRLGVRHTFTDTLDGSTGTDAALAHHRLGPLFAWQFTDKAPGARFNQPTLFVLAQWWLQHPYRTGDEQPRALPLVAVGFAFNGDWAISGS
jgi:hypothetical protein